MLRYCQRNVPLLLAMKNRTSQRVELGEALAGNAPRPQRRGPGGDISALFTLTEDLSEQACLHPDATTSPAPGAGIRRAV